MASTNYREQFPDAHDERPQVIRVQFVGDSASIDRRVLATAASLRVGDRLYVSVAGYGHPEDYVPTEIVENRDDVVIVKRT